jgi:hypothetical protein
MMKEKCVVDEKVWQEVEYVTNEKHLTGSAELIPGFCYVKKFDFRKNLTEMNDRQFTFMNVETLSSLSQKIKNEKTAIDSKGNRCGIPDKDVTQ